MTPPELEILLHYKQSLVLASPATELFFGGALGGGKATSLHTPVATVDGPKTMGDIVVGDCLVNPFGSTQVIALSEVEIVPTYRLEFCDGSSVEACGDHEWQGRIDNKPPLVGGTTRAIKRNVETGRKVYIPRWEPDADPQFAGKLVTSVSIEKPQAMRCLQVACPSGLYCIGADWTITHNSFLVRALSILYCAEVAGIQVFLFRRTFPELREVHMEGPGSFPALLAPWTKAGLCTVNQYEIKFWNQSRISLHHCQNESDVHSFLGSEIHMLCIDELTTFSQMIYENLRTRCRLGNLQLPPKYQAHGKWPPKFPFILSTSNPGGVSHDYVRREFVDDAEGMVLRRMPPSKGGMLRQFIPSLAADNPTLLENDPSYLDKIRGMSDPASVAGKLRGDWNVVSGSMYGDVWDNAKHICKPFPIPLGWSIWRGCDDGYSNPLSCHWIAYDPVHNRYYVCSEIYQSGLLSEQAANRVLERDRSILRNAHGQIYPHNETLEGIIDSASDADTGTGSPTRMASMNRLGCRWRPCSKSAGSRVFRVQYLHRCLALQRDGLPMTIFFDSCKVAIRAIPSVPRSEKNPEDVDDRYTLLHAIDSLSYGLARGESSFKRIHLTGI
jgi:hypothetical protein